MFLNVSTKSMVRICFYLILIGVSITSWMKLLKEDTTFVEKVVENQPRLPSFTLCPSQPDHPINKKSIESFEDIEKGIELVRQKYRIEYLEYKPFEQDKKYEAFYNDTSYGTLYFAPQIKMKPPFEAVVCLIWTPSRKHKIKPDWSYKVITFIKSSQSPRYILQFHDEGNSPYLYKFAQNEWQWFDRKKLFEVDVGKQIETNNINTSNYTCYEDNSNFFMHCMEKYYSNKMGCLLPWTLNSTPTNDSLNKCKGKEKFKEFKNIAMNILKPEESEELIDERCFIPNCMQRSWTKSDIYQRENEKLITEFQHAIHANSKSLVRQEVKLYTLINFFADVGGYLGLLLGESLLSYFITASTLFQILKRKFKEHCEKADEEPETYPE